MDTQDDDDIYSVPRSDEMMAIDIEQPLQENKGGTSPPPILPPKSNRSSHSFHRVSSILDRQQPVTSPTPTPRSKGQRKSSVDFTVSCEENAKPSLGSLSGSSFSQSVDEIRKYSDDVFESLLSRTDQQSSPQVPKVHPKPHPRSSQHGSVSSESDSSIGRQESPTGISPLSRTTPTPAPRPVPKPRTKVSSTVFERSSPSLPETPIESKTSFSTTVGNSNTTDENANRNPIQSLTTANVPKIEKDDEVQGFPDPDSVELMLDEEILKKYGPMSEMSETQKGDTDVDRNDYVLADAPLVDEVTSHPPPSVHPVSTKPKYINMAGTTTATLNEPPHTKPHTLNLGTELLGESSSDHTTSVTKKEAETSVDPTTPKPFNIKPFTNLVPLAPTDLKHSESDFDISDMDPLKPKSKKAVTANITNSATQYVPFSDSWEKLFTNPTAVISVQDQNVYNEPNDEYAKINKTQDKVAPATPPHPPVSAPRKRSSPTHHEAPEAPPPPLPREQHFIPEPAPPPVPPRPTNIKGDAFSPTPDPFQVGLRPEFTNQSSLSSDIFNQLPTPANVTTEDPFSDSSFDYECHKFNTAQSGTQAVSHPAPSTPVACNIYSKAEQNTEASQNMEDLRLSRFVIPPPRMELGDPDGDSSDSEGVDLANIVHGWPTGGPAGGAVNVLDSPLSPTKKNSRYGYLYKQGGYKANKGWKKRWVVFNGTSLSYYNNNTNQVSKRIIPVSCMTGVESDVKPKDKNSFKFKVVTSLNDRVFLFSAETLDDCITWANVIMAAITEHKKNVAERGEEIERPNKEGFIKFNNSKKFYVAIRGQSLYYYNSFEDFQLGSPIHEIDMKLASVKVIDRKKFKMQLWVHYGHFDLTFESDNEMQQWCMAMEDAIAEGLADDTVLEKVNNNISNKQCADCGAENPHWASINLGIVLCKSCAGVHRMFDYRVSKIRSLRMDTRVWTPSLIELMVIIGNANANMFWEARLPNGVKPHPSASMDLRKDYIIKKYKQRKFCDLHPLHSMGPKALGDELITTCNQDNILDAVKILFSGADILFRKHGSGHTAYEIAKESGHRLIMELLYQNGGDPQSFTDSQDDENRLREDVRLQGFLNKTGPAGKTFDKRWCILEHGALTYYLNERSTTFKGTIDRKEMYFIQEVITDRIGYQFDLSTGVKDNRLFSFSSDCKDDTGEWIRTIAKLMAPVAVMEHVGMIDIKFAGHGYMKESLGDEWRETFLVCSWRGLNYMNQDLKFDYIDLRKASSIIMQDETSGFQRKGPCLVIGTVDKSLYLQAKLARDTEKIFTTLKEAVNESGPTLQEQALTKHNVPVIVERCLAHVEKVGRGEMGIYRNSAQNSRVQTLLNEFRKDAWSVNFSDYTVNEVANALKRFLRELEDSVFERINYKSWVNMAGCQDRDNRLAWYRYYLDKLPIVNYSTLKRIVLHLRTIAEQQEQNKMTLENLATCFAPSLLRTEKDQPDLMSSITSKEIKIILDLLLNVDYFFQIDDEQQKLQKKIKEAEEKIKQANKQTVDVNEGFLTPIHIMSCDGAEHNIMITSTKTALSAMEALKKGRKLLSEGGNFAIYELLFKGALERPIFPDEKLLETLSRWSEWEKWVVQDNGVCLCARDTAMLEKLDANLTTSMLSGKLHYADTKKFKKLVVEFKQSRLIVYSNAKATSEQASWNIEDLTIYIGQQPDRSPRHPTKYGITFLVKGEKQKGSVFGHSLCFDTEDELYRWAAVLYVTRQPKGLLEWNR